MGGGEGKSSRRKGLGRRGWSVTALSDCGAYIECLSFQ